MNTFGTRQFRSMASTNFSRRNEIQLSQILRQLKKKELDLNPTVAKLTTVQIVGRIS